MTVVNTMAISTSTLITPSELNNFRHFPRVRIDPVPLPALLPVNQSDSSYIGANARFYSRISRGVICLTKGQQHHPGANISAHAMARYPDYVFYN